MRKTRFLIVALALLLALTVSGLATAQDATMEAAASAGQVTIRLQTSSSGTAEDVALESEIAAFEVANPDIYVSLNIIPQYETTMQTAFASGDYPEVFYVGQAKLPDWASAGVIAPAEGKVDNVSDFYPALVKVFTYNGTFMCPPKDYSQLALEYNKDMFDAAGMAYPTAAWTWDDLRNAAQKLTANGVYGLSLNADIDRWFTFYFGAGGTLYDAQGNFQFQSQPALDALNYYVGLHRDGFSATAADVGAGWPGEAFGKGLAAMTLEGNWIIQFLLDTYPDLHWGVSEMPRSPSGTQATLTFSVCWAVAADNAHPDESWRLVNYLTGPENELAIARNGFGALPSRLSAADTWLQRAAGYEAFVKGAAYAWADVTPTGFQDFRDLLANDLGSAFDGSKTPQDVVDDATSLAQTLMSQMATATPAQ